jgi:hypothetical protein
MFLDVLEFLRDSVSDEKPEVSEKNLASKIADELKDRLVTLKLLVYSFFSKAATLNPGGIRSRDP